MPTKKLTVSLPNYNHGHLIGDMLLSILNQSYEDFEVIVVDDGSTDNSLGVIQGFLQRDNRVSLIRNLENKGVLFSLKKILTQATGEYIVFLSADDKVLPGFFEKSMNLLCNFPEAGLCCSNPVMIDSSSDEVKIKELRLNDSPCYFPPEKAVSVVQAKRPWIACHASIINRKSLISAGNMISELRWHCDWFALLVVAFRQGFCYLPESLSALRTAPFSYASQGVTNRPAQLEIIENMLRILTSPPYSDVSESFRKSAVLSCYGSKALWAALKNPEALSFITPRMLFSALITESYRILSQRLPYALRKALRPYKDKFL